MKQRLTKVLKIIWLWFVLYITFAVLFKGTLLYSSSDMFYIQANDVQLLNYERNEEGFVPLTGDCLLGFNLPELDSNGIRIELITPASEDMDVILYALTPEGYVDPIDNAHVLIGDTQIELTYDVVCPRILYLTTTKTISFEYIAVTNYIFNPLQKNAKWICCFVIANLLALAIALTSSLCTRKKEKRMSKLTVPIRESNLELLRIVCMLLIIAHHCVVHGGAIYMDYSTNKLISYCFLPVGKICFIAFIAISMWFMVDSNFKASRFTKTWCEVFYYSVAFTIFSLSLGTSLTVTEFLSCFLPMLGNSHGFASSYLLFYLLLPFITKVFDGITKKQARLLLLCTFCVQVLSKIIGQIGNYTQPISSELTLFIFCYVLSYNLKRWPIKILSDKTFTGCLALGIYLLLLQCSYMPLWWKGNKITDFISSVTSDESSLLMIVAGYSLFFFVKEIRIRENKYINKVATFTFGILLIHDHNLFRTHVWNYWAQTKSWYKTSNFFLYILVTTVFVFVVCGTIDFLRQKYIEKLLIKSKPIKKIEKVLNEIVTRGDI